MLFEPFFNKLEDSLAAQSESGVQVPSLNSYTIDTNIFSNVDLEGFKQKIADGLNLDGSSSIFYKTIESAGVESVFDYFDKNGDGVIDDDELNEVASSDGNEEDISSYDITQLFNKQQYQKIIDNCEEQIDDYRAQAAAQASSSTTNNSSSTSSTGSTGSGVSKTSSNATESLQSTIDKALEEDIPALEEQKEQIIAEADEAIEEQNNSLNTLVKNNNNILSDDNQYFQQIQKANDQIDNYNKNIDDANSEKFGYESTLSNLQAEYDAIKTDTKNDEVNKANEERKSEIQEQIKEIENKIELLENRIERYEKSIETQEQNKKTAEDKLAELQTNSKNDAVKSMQEIQSNIEQIRTDRDKKVAQIDKQIEEKRTEIIEQQQQLGELTGKASSGPFANYNAEAGQALANSALNVPGTYGRCLGGVNNSLCNTEYFGDGMWFESAYMAIDALQGNVSGYENLASKFEEVTDSVSREELASLPAGAIVVWEQDPQNVHGHISISLGDGRESSDHIIAQEVNRDAQYHVFIPV